MGESHRAAFIIYSSRVCFDFQGIIRSDESVIEVSNKSALDLQNLTLWPWI